MSDRRKIKEIELGNKEVFDIKDEFARNEIAKYHGGNWFFICDSYGVASVSSNPFPARLKADGHIEDELSVGMMSYNGSVNVLTYLQDKVNSMSRDEINRLTDIVSCLGLNDTWSNYNLIQLDVAVRNFIDFCFQTFPNLNRIHLAPIGNEFDKSVSDAENQPNRMKMVQHVIKKCVRAHEGVCFVDNSQIAMNCPAYFMSDGTHPNEEGSTMLYNNFLSYMRNGNFPINTYSYLHPLDEFGFRYIVEYVGSTCSGSLQWSSDVPQFELQGLDDFSIIYSGSIELPIMKKLQLNPSIVVRDTGTSFTRGVFGLLGLTPNTPTHAGMILSAHANTGTSEPEYYNHITFYQSFSYSI